MTLTDFLAALIERVADLCIFIIDCFPVLIWFAVWFMPWAGMTAAGYFFLLRPFRRREKAYVFLDEVETASAEVRCINEVDLFAQNRVLPRQIVRMLHVGRELGDIRKVLPACRRAISSGSSSALGAQNYFFVFTPAFPLFFFVVGFVSFVILPKFRQIFAELLEGRPLPASTRFVIKYLDPRTLIEIVGLALAVILLLIVLRVFFRNSFADRLIYLLPWRRKRMERDFSAMLGILLDAGVPEDKAVTMAAECTANSVFVRRARWVVQELQQGVKLTKAIQRLDDTGEFRWRLENATHNQGGFTAALTGWHDSLEAKAYQQEQAVSQIVTTALVILNGVLVGLICLAFFQPLTEAIYYMALW